jgi:DNA-binding SARP family transcriptional activator
MFICSLVLWFSVLGSRFSGSAVQRFSSSAVLGSRFSVLGSAVQQFSGSAVQRFSGSALPLLYRLPNREGASRIRIIRQHEYRHMTLLKIQLFGEPYLYRNDIPLEITRRKSRVLVFYLAAHPGAVPRNRLLNLFWPDHDRAAAQQSLRTTLHGLRRELGPELASSDQDLAITPFATVDARFLAHTIANLPNLPIAQQEQRLNEALALYRGEFLTGIELPENPEIEEWIAAERERYRRIALRGFGLLAQRRSERLDYPAALEALTQAMALDPLNETLQREAMLTEYRLGDRAAAIRRYERLRDTLDEQLGVPPLAETRAMYDSIITDNLQLPVVSVAAPVRAPYTKMVPPAEQLPFVGREPELARMQQLVDSAQLILLEGEPGIGKSHLASYFIQQTQRFGLVGTARELEHAIPYHPVIEALRCYVARPDWPERSAKLVLAPIWRAEIARLLPELGPESRPLNTADEARVWEAVSQFVQAIAQHEPVVLFLDDIHWADMATLGLIGYIARRAPTGQLTIIAATRTPVPRTPLALLLQTLTREARLVRIALPRLNRAATDTLAKSVSPNFPDPLAAWLEQAAEGNPYFAIELLRYVREQHLIGPNGTLLPGIEQAGPLVPQTVESLILSRLAKLSDRARLLLDLAVAAGREFTLEAVAHASELSEAAILDALDELRITRLIEPLADSRWRFDHSLTMEVAYREVGEPRHRQLHRRLAEALESLHAGYLEEIAGTLVWHYAEAGLPQRGARYALTAARQAAAMAGWQEAIQLYRQALSYEGSPANKHAILMELGDAQQHISHSSAADVYREAAELARRSGNQAATDAARLALAQTLVAQARFAEVVDIAQQVRQSGHPGSAVRAEMVWGIALSVEGADLAGALQHLQIAASLNDAESDPSTHSNITFELGNILAQQGDLPAAIGLYREALFAAERDPGAIFQRILAHNNLAYHLHLLGDPEAQTHIVRGLQLANDVGGLFYETFLRSTHGEIAMAQGDLATAETAFSTGLALAERLRLPERIAGLTANLGLAAHRQGQLALAIHRLSSAQAQADTLGIPHLSAQIRIWLVPLLPAEEARQTLATARGIAESGGRKRLLAEIVKLEQALGAGS